MNSQVATYLSGLFGFIIGASFTELVFNGPSLEVVIVLWLSYVLTWGFVCQAVYTADQPNK